MSFDNIVFPLIVERCSVAPEYNTTIITAGNGSEQRFGNWQDARLTFNAGMGVRSIADLHKLIDFFRARKGRLRGFLVKDLSDYQAIGEPFGVGTGTQRYFQLIKTYGDAENVDIRKIIRPTEGTVTVYRGAVLMSDPADYTVNFSTGVVTFTVAPAAGQVLTWFGDFYIPCRFAEDKLPVDEIFFDMVENKAAGGIPDVVMVEIFDSP